MGGFGLGVGFPACVTESLSQEECLLSWSGGPDAAPSPQEQTGPGSPSLGWAAHTVTHPFKGLKLPPGGLGLTTISAHLSGAWSSPSVSSSRSLVLIFFLAELSGSWDLSSPKQGLNPAHGRRHQSNPGPPGSPAAGPCRRVVTAAPHEVCQWAVTP